MPPYRGLTPVPEFALHTIRTVLDSSTMTVGWTITPDVLVRLTAQEKAGNKSWMMLFVFSENHHHELRKIVPLRDCIAYLGLNRPGKTKIYGQILCGPKKDVFRTWLAKDHPGRWENSAYTCLGDDGFPGRLDAMKEHVVHEEISIFVEVPKEVFAKAPPSWEARWVNRCFLASAHDQCGYRRRRLFAYTVQPLMAVIWTLVVAVFQLLSLTLALIKPARWPWSGMGLSGEDACGEPLVSLKGLLVLRAPVLWWMPALLTWSSFRNHHGRFDLQGIVVLSGVAVPALVLFGALLRSGVFFGILAPLAMGPGVAVELVTKSLMKLLNRILSTALTDEDIFVLTTPRQERAPMELRDLPASKRTIKLRFFDLKAKVCRPFAR